MPKDSSSFNRPIRFAFHEASRLLADWRKEAKSGQSVWSGLKRYARRHGAAGAWLASDRYVLFYMEGERLRQKSWRYARPICLDQPAVPHLLKVGPMLAGGMLLLEAAMVAERASA